MIHWNTFSQGEISIDLFLEFTTGFVSILFCFSLNQRQMLYWLNHVPAPPAVYIMDLFVLFLIMCLWRGLCTCARAGAHGWQKKKMGVPGIKSYRQLWAASHGCWELGTQLKADPRNLILGLYCWRHVCVSLDRRSQAGAEVEASSLLVFMVLEEKANHQYLPAQLCNPQQWPACKI